MDVFLWGVCLSLSEFLNSDDEGFTFSRRVSGRREFLAEGDFEIERSLLCILDFLGFCRLKIRRITTLKLIVDI